MIKSLEDFSEREEKEITFLKARSRLAQEDRESGKLISADQVISDLRQYVKEI